jgi:hypothetical protein
MSKNTPVTVTGADNHAVWLVTDFIYECESCGNIARRVEDPRVSDNSEKAAEDGVSHTVSLVAIDQVF